jgi:hypothetical protein
VFCGSESGFLLGLNSFGEVRTLQKRPASSSLSKSKNASTIINEHTHHRTPLSASAARSDVAHRKWIERKRMDKYQRNRQDTWRTSKIAKSLPDSGISAPSGNPELSALLKVTGCPTNRMGTAGHVLGFDFFKSNITLNPHAMERVASSVMGVSPLPPPVNGGKTTTELVGAISFNEAVMNCPSALQCCTACNRTDFYDKASNMGLCSSWEMPYHAFSGISKFAEGRYDSSRPVVCRSYVARTRVKPTKELDAMEIGDAMCTNGCSFGLTYMGSMKVDPLTTVVMDAMNPLKKRMVRYSIAKLLRQKLPVLLEERFITRMTISDEEEYQNYPWKYDFFPRIFCSFEHTRTFLCSISSLLDEEEEEEEYEEKKEDVRNTRSALMYLKNKFVRQFAWLVQTKKMSVKDFHALDEYIQANGMNPTTTTIHGDYEKCPLHVKDIYERLQRISIEEREEDSSRPSSTTLYDDTILPDRPPESVSEHSDFDYILHGLSHATWNASCYESADVFSTFHNPEFRNSENSAGHDTTEDPPEWRGPWYKSTQCFDEDEMAFYNLDYGYLVHAYQWVCNQLCLFDAMETSGEFAEFAEMGEPVFSEFSVLCTLLIKLYCVNDLMHALNPTRDRMMRLLLQLFADQMLDLYSHFLFYTDEKKREGIPWILDDASLLLSPLEREEFTDFKEGKISHLFRQEWKERCDRPNSGDLLQRSYDQFYPHGRRFVWSGELPELSNLLVFTELWNKVRPSGDTIACFIIHIILGKAQPHRCQIRSLATVLKQYANREPSIILMLIDMLMVQVLGNYPGAIHRPCYRSRAVLRQQFFEFAVRDIKEIKTWVDLHQHFVYICLREHLYMQMEKVFSLRGMMADLSWQLENEVHTRYVSEMCRVILSDRLRKATPEYLEQFIATDNDFRNMQDLSTTNEANIHSGVRDYVEEMNANMRRWENQHVHCAPENGCCSPLPRFMFTRDYSPHAPVIRDIIYTHMLIGYRERLHMKKMNDEDADKIIYTMRQKDIFELLEVVSDEAGIKSREYQTKSRKGNFIEMLLQFIQKLIVTHCPHVLELGMKEKLDNARILEGLSLRKKTVLEERLKGTSALDVMVKELVDQLDRAEKTYRVFKSHRERVEQNMLSDISSYLSNVYSVMECDGILSGSHIKAIKMMAKFMAQSTEDGEQLNLTYLLLLGVSMSSISYLYFLLYAYNYHDLPDNRLKTDVIYLLNKRYQKPVRKGKKKKQSTKGKGRKSSKRARVTLSKKSEDQEKMGEEENTTPLLCYGSLSVPLEDWFDIRLVDLGQGEISETSPPTSLFSLDPENTQDPVVKMPWNELDKRLKEAMEGPLGKDVVQTPDVSCDPYLCYDPTRCDTFYTDDDEELDYTGEDGKNEIQWRRNRVCEVLGRDPTIGEIDVVVIAMFFHFFLHAKFLKVMPLTTEIADLQTRAMVRRANLVYSEQPVPEDIGITRFCGCGKWVDPIVTGPNDISMIYANGEDLAAYDLLRKCKRCHKGETRMCEKLNEIDMIGKVVCFGRLAFVICVICGSRTLWRRESYCELGPTCGCHAAPIRPPSKYPLSVVALKSRRNMELRRAFLNNGALMNGWVECSYCKEYITPGKVRSFVVWDDTSYYERMPSDFEESFAEGDGSEEEDLERHSKSGHIRKSVVHLCEDHVKYIRWNLRNINAIYTKRKMIQDIRAKTQRGMERRMSTRYAKAT